MERLDEIYPETPVPLNHRSKFELLIAVLLSAQCTDERVNQVTPHLFSLADNPLAMSKLQTEKDLKRLFPKECWNKLHLQIIFYGREYCTARGCLGIKCNICRTLYPNRIKPIKTKK